MPHEVIMPALGMAQETGLLVRWIKQAGDAVTEGEALFEVETDKATMEVEAQATGYLADVSAAEGDAVPVGATIARIRETPATDAPPKAEAAAEQQPRSGTALPEGEQVIMPALGMSQDQGLIVNWRKAPGDSIANDDVLFEVETDKSTVEVSAGHAGYLAAVLAKAGDEVPVGETVAIISVAPPQTPVDQAWNAASAVHASPTETSPTRQASTGAGAVATPPARRPAPPASGRILASPKLRRLALERGLELEKLADAGHSQPFHARDLEELERLCAAGPAAAAEGRAARRATARLAFDGFSPFASWARENGVTDPAALLAGLAATSLRRSGDTPRDNIVIAVEVFGARRHYHDADLPTLRGGLVEEAGDTADLILRDLRQGPVACVAMGPEATPVLTLTGSGNALEITLECGAEQLSAHAALTLLSEFAGRMEQPLRHLL
jgi:pyruvate/2-oxoglutarate dehydrogenase complex dihydrolipoamide acyltransferase (E2) component